MGSECQARPHVLVLPFPAQGHINPIMQLAHILVNSDILVTFANTDDSHKRMVRHLNSFTNDRMRFVSFPDGLPPNHGRIQQLPELVDAWKEHAPRHIDTIIQDLKHSSSPVSVIITDGNSSSFVHNVAQKHGLPWYAFWTLSAVGWAGYCATPLLKQRGIVPLPEEEGARRQREEELVGCLDGMEELRVKDLPSFFTGSGEYNRYMMEWLGEEAQRTHPTSGVILNTWEDVEGGVVEELNKSFCNKVLTVGPLILLSDGMPSISSLWEETPTCLEWLDKQRPRSVIYVGFGSIALLDESQLEELAWGLQMSGQPFLWVIRPDLINGKESENGLGLPKGYAERCGERACFVSWAPQRKVLNHPSVAGFLTHCGWNSAIEGICAGVPMICWPYFAEQQTNRRFICERWKFGIEVNEQAIHRDGIQSAIKSIMDAYKLFKDNEEEEEKQGDANLIKNARRYRDGAFKAASHGGSSQANIEKLIQNIIATSKALP